MESTLSGFPHRVLLHGFAQDGRAWDGVVNALDSPTGVVCPDLRGHGEAFDLRPIDSGSMVDDLLQLTRALKPVVLCGYSMGARLALDFVLAYPQRVERLVLVSPTAGIGDPKLRRDRVIEDGNLAELLEREGIEAFTDEWEQKPIWDGEPEAIRTEARKIRLRQHPEGLADSLRGFGAGVWEAKWDRLHELRLPTTLVAGERDPQCLRSGGRMASLIDGSELAVIPGAGHSLLLEAPSELAGIIGG